MLKGLVRHLLHITGRSHLASFLQGLLHLGRPSSIAFPPELVEQGVAIALSGLANTMAIQSNPDWVWPAWVCRQTDPDDPAFVPTGLNLITTNLTLRNWTSIGVPGSSREAMVDPVGMVTPRAWSWSILPCLGLDGAILAPPLLPGRVRQSLLPNAPGLRTEVTGLDGLTWEWDTLAAEVEGHEAVILELRLRNTCLTEIVCSPGVSLRPCNPLSLGPIRLIRADPQGIRVDGKTALHLARSADHILVSDRHHGDPLLRPRSGLPLRVLRSRSGMATAVATWEVALAPGGLWEASCLVPLDNSDSIRKPGPRAIRHARERAESEHRRQLARGTHLSVPDPRIQAGWDALLGRLHVFDDGTHFTPGTFLYHEHWFRDAAFLSLGFENVGRGDSVAPKMDLLRTRQKRNGLFRSQTGEWDSNGQALWTLGLHLRRGGALELADRYWPQVRKGVDWILHQRAKTRDDRSPHRGLLPAGFSAEHFGPNDHYFWDNFWSIAGMEEVERMALLLGKAAESEQLAEEIGDYRTDLEAGIAWAADRGDGVLGSSPYRRPDAASVGNLVAVCPLGVVPPSASWVRPTVEFLSRHCLRDGLFFQPIVHTGLNPYLSAQLARAKLALGDADGCMEILQALARSASPTWCWPEAIHPRTGGGCMGDGDHGWAAAEFLSLVRQILVRETSQGLELLSGVPAEWITLGLRLTGATTTFGTLDLEVRPEIEGRTRVEWTLVRSTSQESGVLTLVIPNSDRNCAGLALSGAEGPSRSIRRRHILPSSTGYLVLEPDGTTSTEIP